jgi:hypothetical protein
MKIAVMQPTYLPWIGYFELIDGVDLFVFFDDVHFNKRSWHRRNRIKTVSGEFTLTIPVLCKGKQMPLIKDTPINNEIPWKRKHLANIKSNYSKAKFFGLYIHELETLYSHEYKWLLDLNLAFIEFLRRSIGINTPTILSSSLKISDTKDERLINICKKLNAKDLYDAHGAMEFLNIDLFKKNGINLTFQQYKHPVYRQLHGDFISHLSALDLLLNEGERALDIIRSGRFS